MLRRVAAVVLSTLFLVTPSLAAREPRILRLKFPKVAVPPRGTTEGCAFVRIPRAQPFDMSTWEMRNRARGLTVVHALVYLYQGERLGELPSGVVFSRGCLDLGPEDRDHRIMIAAATTARARGLLPAGVALALPPVPAAPGGSPEGLAFLIDVNWQNAGDRPRRASATVTLRRGKRGTVRRLALPFADRSAELGLSVPPFTVGSTEDSTTALNAARPGEPPARDSWSPSGDACLVMLSPRMHRRGRFFGADLVGSDGTTRNPPGGTQNPFEAGRTHLYGALDYTDPGLRMFSPPQLVRAGEAIHYLCYHDNGATRALRLGCEEPPGGTPGVASGLPGGRAAKPCTALDTGSAECPPTDAAFPGRTFTGACIPANLVAGSTPDDEVCAVTGAYFDAVPGVVPGAECDPSSLSPIE